jgi:hypothetical protein
MRGELADAFRRITRVGKDIATGNVDLAVERQGDGVSLGCTSERTVEADDLFDPRGAARACDQHLIDRRNRTGNNRARETAELAIRAVDPLDRKTERPLVASHLDRAEMLEQGRPLVPRHMCRPCRNIVAQSRRERDDADQGVAETGGKGRELRRDFLEAVLVESKRSILLTASTRWRIPSSAVM